MKILTIGYDSTSEKYLLYDGTPGEFGNSSARLDEDNLEREVREYLCERGLDKRKMILEVPSNANSKGKLCDLIDIILAVNPLAIKPKLKSN
jgi:hypothetical protein